jgi:2,3-bisphosphoglycerate-independent phosphoglycerate mutase
MRLDRHVLIFFMDGVGLGEEDPETNPFVRARLPHLEALLGEGWYVRDQPHAPGGAGEPGTDGPDAGRAGAAAERDGPGDILTGRNVPELIGEHYGPKPNRAVAAHIEAGTLFDEVVRAGGRAALLTPYPQRYFEAIESGRRLLSAVPLAASNAGLPLRNAADLRAGRAVSPDFTARGWRDQLGYDDMPVLSAEAAGARIGELAQAHHFSFFEHWPSDRTGHRGTLQEAVAHLELIDAGAGRPACRLGRRARLADDYERSW